MGGQRPVCNLDDETKVLSRRNLAMQMDDTIRCVGQAERRLPIVSRPKSLAVSRCGTCCAPSANPANNTRQRIRPLLGKCGERNCPPGPAAGAATDAMAEVRTSPSMATTNHVTTDQPTRPPHIHPPTMCAPFSQSTRNEQILHYPGSKSVPARPQHKRERQPTSDVTLLDLVCVPDPICPVGVDP